MKKLFFVILWIIDIWGIFVISRLFLWDPVPGMLLLIIPLLVFTIAVIFLTVIFWKKGAKIEFQQVGSFKPNNYYLKLAALIIVFLVLIRFVVVLIEYLKK